MSVFYKNHGIPLFQEVAASMIDTFTQRTSPLNSKNINISATNGSTPPIPIYPINIWSTTNSSTPPISIYLLNILWTTNGSTPPNQILQIKKNPLLIKLTPAKIHEVIKQSSTHNTYVQSLRITITKFCLRKLWKLRLNETNGLHVQQISFTLFHKTNNSPVFKACLSIF